MARTSLHKSLKQVLHGNEGSSGAEPNLSRSDVLLTTADTCINRENPNRDVSSQENIVVGYDFDGTYDNLIKRGFTQGYWTLPPFLTPANLVDDAGARNAYLSRALLEFDIKDSAAFASGQINHAFLSLTFSSHKSLARVDGITLDFHTFYCASSFTGGSNTGGATCGNITLWDGTATWYEWKYTGACEFDTGVGEGLSGPDDPDSNGAGAQDFAGVIDDNIGVAPPGNAIAGFTGNIWSHQGLGASGGLGQVVLQAGSDGSPSASGKFLDFSQGDLDSGHYDTDLKTTGLVADNFGIYPSVHLTNREISSNKKLILDVTNAVKFAVRQNKGVMRIMINVRHDFIYNRGEQAGRAKDRAFVGFHSRETSSESGLLQIATNSSKITNQAVPKFAPHLIINYN